jgi:hypothetical protein
VTNVGTSKVSRISIVVFIVNTVIVVNVCDSYFEASNKKTIIKNDPFL